MEGEADANLYLSEIQNLLQDAADILKLYDGSNTS